MMMEERAPESSRINQIDIVNADLQLSEFKHHLILRKVFLPQDHPFQQFAHNIYKYFSNVNLEYDSICFIQIEAVYDNSFYDILVGFKRDTDAFSVFRVSPGFNFMNQDIPIELAQAFSYYLEFKGTYVGERVQNKKNVQSQSHLLRKKKSFQESDQRNQSRSRSRDKEKPGNKRQVWVGSLLGIFPPVDWTKSSLKNLLTDTLRCAKNEISVEQESKEGVSYFLINFRSQTLISAMLNGTRATEGSLLLLRQQEVHEHGLLQAIKIRQIKAYYTSNTPCTNVFKELCKALISFRQFNLRVVTVVPQEDHFVVVIQNRVQNILKFLKISGWKFDLVSQAILFPPQSTDKWFFFNSANDQK